MKIAFAILALYLAIPLLIVGAQQLAEQDTAVSRAAATAQLTSR